MSPKILIIGFQRSGTTLLRRAVHHHPDVSYCIHEKKVLRSKNLEKYLSRKFNVDVKDVWGEKIPWYNGSGTSIINYCSKWLKKFDEEARIIHIKRHPKDVALSNIKLGWASSEDRVIKMCNQSVNRVVKSFENEERFLGISFEDLVTEPFDTCVKIFKFCGLDYSDQTIKELISPGKEKWRYFKGINQDRALAHKKKNR